MILDLRQPLVFFRLLAFAAVPAVIIVHVIGPTPWAFALDAIALAHWLSHVWLVRTFPRRPVRQTMLFLCVAQFSTAIAFTLVEPWLLHLTPLVCLGPVILATRWVDERLYRRLALASILVILGLSLFARLSDRTGPVYDASDETTRSMIAVLFTPALSGFVGWTAWHNQRAMRRQNAELMASQVRIEQTDSDARARFETLTATLREDLEDARLAASSRVPGVEIAELRSTVQRASADLRTIAHGFAPAEFSLDDERYRAVVEEAAATPMAVVGELGERLPVVDWLVRSVLIELRAPAEVSRKGEFFVIEVKAADDRAARACYERLSVDTVDRIDATGGWHTDDPAGGPGLRIDIRAGRGETDVQSSRRRTVPDLRSDLLLGAVFPVVAFSAALLLGLTVLRDDDMVRVAGLTGAIFMLPCLAAWWYSSRWPRASLVVFVGAHWVAAIAITDQLDVTKWFGAVALLIPVLLALPHVRGPLYAWLAVGTATVTAFMIAIARFGDQIQIASDASDGVTDLTIIGLVPLTCALVLLLAMRNHETIAAAAQELRESRRNLVEASDRARRKIERDLHDGTQQRLVSAAVRLQIADRVTEGERDQNLQLAADELAAAVRSLAGLAAGRHPIGIGQAGLGQALTGLAAASPVPILVRIDRLPQHLGEDVASSVWFCCSEAVTNAIKHAGSQIEIIVDVRIDDGAIEFAVVDDGCGFVDDGLAGSGLANIRERCVQHGGTLAVESSAGRGTAVNGRIPVAAR